MKSKIIEGEKHFTASVWILTRSASSGQGSTSPKKMLLVYHKKFNKWMQPGGHIEGNENPLEAAVRETFEETGLNIDFLFDQIKNVDNEGKFLPVPKFIMEQTIQAHLDQPLHYHIDMEYVVEVEEQDLKFSESESSDIGWFTKAEIWKLPVHEDTKIVVEELMN